MQDTRPGRGANGSSTAARHFAIAFADQALTSATNFAVGILLVRQVSAAEYGRFVLASSALFLALGVQNALVAIPMSVLAPKRRAEEQGPYVAALVTTQFLVWLPLVAILVAGALAGAAAGALDRELATLVIVTTVVAVSFIFREFLRQALFVFRRPAAVLASDSAYCALYLAAVAGITASSNEPALGSILAIGVASVAGGALALAILHGLGAVVWTAAVGGRLPTAAASDRLPTAAVSGRWSRASLVPLAESWKLARWGLPGMLVGWLQNQGFLYLLAAWSGAEAVAAVSAARLLLMPVGVSILALGGIVRPRAAAWLAAGERSAMIARVSLVAIVTGLLAAGYGAALWLACDLVAARLFGKEIPDLGLLVALWGVVFVVQVFRESLMMILQVLERFDRLFYYTLAGSLTLLATGYATIPTRGAAGSLVALAAGEAVYLAGLVVFLVRSSRERST